MGKISIQPARKIITAQEIYDHCANDINLHWVKLKDLETSVSEQCVDGRSKKGIIGTPGGDLGEFILFVDSIENVLNREMVFEELQKVFVFFHKHIGPFYHHSDMHGLHHIWHHVEHDENWKKAGVTTFEQFQLAIKNPPQPLRSQLEDLLVLPENIGCGHLRLMQLHADEYDVRPSLVQDAMRLFYRTMWDGENVDFVVLDADHQESAVVTVSVKDEEITGETEIPTISSMDHQYQMFVIHPQAIAYLRKRIAKRFFEEQVLPDFSERDLQELISFIDHSGSNFARLTLSYLALGLPQYAITIEK